MDERRVALLCSEPIFPVTDVVATVGYYREVLASISTVQAPANTDQGVAGCTFKRM